MNTGKYVSFKLAFLFFRFYRNGIIGSYSNSVVVVVLAPLFFHSGCTNLHAYQQCMGFPFLHILATICNLCCLDDSHSDNCRVMYYCGFNLHFADVVMLSNLSAAPVGPLLCLLWETVYSGLLPIFKLSCLFYWY